MDQKRKSRVQRLVTKLTSSSESEVFNTLIEIRKNVLKSKEGISLLTECGGIQKILQVLSKDGINSKTVDITFSILGNLCMDNDARKLVQKANGVEIVAHVFVESKEESIQNRGARTLANIALTHENIGCILKTEAVEKLGKLLQTTKTKEHLLTYSRTARLLATTSKQLEKLLSENIVLYLAKHLEETDEEVKSSVLRSVFELSSISCSPGFASQIVSSGALPVLLSLLSHHDDTVIHQSVTLIHRLSHQANFRPGFGSADGITIFLEFFQNEKNLIDKNILLNVLCMCCKESVSRIKIRDHGILQVFLRCLCGNKYSSLHEKLISAVQCFVFDDASISVLLENGLVKILINHLQRVAKFQSVVCSAEDLIPTFIKEDEMDKNIANDHELFHRLYQLPPLVDLSNRLFTLSKNISKKETNEKATTEEMDQSDCEEVQVEARKSVVYSIDSPTYIPQSNWNLDQYTKGETCKQTFYKSDSDSLSTGYSPLSTVSYYSPKNSSSGGESPAASNQYSSSSSNFSFCSPGCSTWSGNESSPEYSFSESTVNKNPKYGMVCSVPHSYNSPIKSGNLMELSPSSSPLSCVQYEFSSCDSDGCEEINKNKPSQLEVSEETFSVNLTNSMTDIKVEETLSLNKIRITVDDCAKKKDLKISKYEKEMISGIKGENEDLKSNKTKRTNEDQNDVEIEAPSKRRKFTASNSDKSTKFIRIHDTENHILILLSRVSQMNDPSQYLVTMEVICCLLDYIDKVSHPQLRAARLLSRLAKNPLCFEKLVQMKFVLMVYYKLSLYNYKDFIDKLSETENCILNVSEVKKKDQRQRSSGSEFNTKHESQHSFLEISTDSFKPIAQSEGTQINLQDSSNHGNHGGDETKEDSCIKARVGLTLLQDMCIQTDSYFGRGEIERLLYRYPDKIGEWLAIDMIYILWLNGMQEYYLTRMKFLDKILHIIQTESVNTPKYQAALQGLAFLGRMIKLPMKSEKLSPETEYTVYTIHGDIRNDGHLILEDIIDTDVLEGQDNCRFKNIKITDKVVFQVENQKVVCCRQALSESSPLFAAMLHGKFLEANQEEVLIEDTTFYAFQYLIHYLSKCSVKCSVINHLLTCDISSESVINCIEVFSLAIKYMVEGLKSFLLSVLSKRLMTATSACHVFHFALLHEFTDLADESVICVTKRGDNLEGMKGLYKFFNGQNKQPFLLILRGLFRS